MQDSGPERKYRSELLAADSAANKENQFAMELRIEFDYREQEPAVISQGRIRIVSEAD